MGALVDAASIAVAGMPDAVAGRLVTVTRLDEALLGLR
jgi:hypothetical protein